MEKATSRSISKENYAKKEPHRICYNNIKIGIKNARKISPAIRFFLFLICFAFIVSVVQMFLSNTLDILVRFFFLLFVVVVFLQFITLLGDIYSGKTKNR